MSGRLLDWYLGLKEEKGHRWALRQWAQRRVAAGWAVKRNIVAREGAAVRKVAMLPKGGEGGGGKDVGRRICCCLEVSGGKMSFGFESGGGANKL